MGSNQKPEHINQNDPRSTIHDPRILIVRLDRVGDVVLSTPVIKAVRDAYPSAHIAFMVRPHSHDTVHGNPYLDEVIVYDKGGREHGLSANIQFIMEIKRKGFDIAIILHPSVRTHWVTFLAGIPVRIGYNKKCGFLLTKRIPHNKQFGLKHESEYTIDLIRHIGIEPQAGKLYVPINPESEARIEYIFGQNNIGKADTVVVINPSASCPSKRWPADRFALVGDTLAEKYVARTILISSYSDREFAGRTASAMKNKPLNISGLTTISELASLLKRVRILISNDSGPVHIACAVGTPVVAIFGRADRGLSPRRWGPSGERDAVLHKNVGCDVCLAHNCRRGFKCLDAVSVDEVVGAADRILC